MSLQRKILEKGTMLMHYIWFIGIAFWLLNPSMAMIWIVMSEFITGTLLSLVFILNHNGKEVYNTSKDFVNAQVRESISFPLHLHILCRHPQITSISTQKYVLSNCTSFRSCFAESS
jgi:hypothetical protein